VDMEKTVPIEIATRRTRRLDNDEDEDKNIWMEKWLKFDVTYNINRGGKLNYTYSSSAINLRNELN